MKGFLKYGSIVLFFLFLLIPHVTADADDREYRVLFISSYAYSWASIPFQIDGLSKSLPADQYTLNYEFMDTKNTNYTGEYDEFYEYLKFKLKNRAPYDGIIVGDDAALQFMMMYKDELFPNTPIVFEGIDDINMGIAFSEDPQITGIVERVDYAANLELADKLYPQATQLVLIYDNLENGVGIANQLKEISGLFKQYEVEYVNTSDYTKEEFIEKLSAYDENSIVFGISIGEQKGNIIYGEDERYKIIDNYANVPVFSITYAGVGNGMLGGFVIDHAESGLVAGEMMRSILEEDIFPTIKLDTPSTYYFDYDVLKKFNISSYKLPENSTVINKPEKFFQKYAIWIVVFLSIGLTSALIAYYFRRKSNDKLQKMYNQLVVAESSLKEQYAHNEQYIETLIEQEKHIRHQAEYDDLTDLPNRRTAIQRLEKLTEDKTDFTIIIIDLDDFKNINDAHGHTGGDRVIYEIANRLANLADDKTHVSRFGSDEFLLIMNGIENSRTAFMIERIQQAFMAPIIFSGIECYVQVSMGIADSNSVMNESSDIVSNADMALFEAKLLGKNTYVYYETYMREKFLRFKKVQDILTDACETDGFDILYQPQIDAKTEQVCGYEALLRLKKTFISPAEFIPVAESSDLILTIGRIVTKKVIEQLAEWREKGMTLYPVAINFSTKQVLDYEFVNYLQSLLKDYEISPELIEIEFTESIFIDNDEQAVKLFEDFKALGIHMALDDFGTGYSSISYLTYIPVDKIKLDKSIIDIYLLEGEGEFIGNIIRLSHSLGLTITIEGVEEKEQYDRLKQLGCDVVQGYYFSKPIQASEVEKLPNPIK